MKICLMKESKSFLFLFFHKLIQDNIISFFPSKKKSEPAYLPLYVFEKTRVSCYKLCEKNKSIKLQKIKLSRLLVQRINEIKYRQETTQNVLTVLHNTLHYLRLSH